MIQLVLWIVTLIFTSTTDEGINDFFFLGNSLETLEKWGMRMPYKIKESAELWRLIVSLYLSYGFS